MQAALTEIGRDTTRLNQLLLYSAPEGVQGHREIVAEWLNREQVAVDAERLMFTAGAQHGVQMALQALTRSGDTLLVERLTYPGMISLARSRQLTLKPVAMDDRGLEPAALDAACRQHQPRLLYTIPTLQNPTTITMDLARRQEIVRVCERHDVLIVEDDVHGLLPQRRPPPLVNFAPERVVHIGGLGKALAPGLRVGYLQAPAEHRQGLVAAVQNHSWMISPLLTALTAQLIRQGAADTLLQDIRRQMASRWTLVASILRDVQIHYHAQGFHGWLHLPPQWSLSEFLMACRQQSIDVKSSELFIVPGHPAPAMVRLAASAPADLSRLRSSLEGLAEILQQEPRTDLTL